MFKKEKGITLVALVVTIIVLLILAGVTISMTLSGDNLFQRARNSTDAYNHAASQESNALGNYVQFYDEMQQEYATYPNTSTGS